MLGPKDILSKSTKNLGAIALIKPIVDGIGIKEIVDRYAPMRRERGITNGDAVQVMVLNRLTSPTPLYSVEEWAGVHALEEVFGIAPDEVNYDRLARALDAISTRIEDIEADISLRMMSKYRIRPEIVHLDASSLYFEGAYEDSLSLPTRYASVQCFSSTSSEERRICWLARGSVILLDDSADER